MMKRKLTALFLAGMLCMSMTACGDNSNTDEVDELANEMQDSMGSMVITPSQSVMNAMANTWNVVDSEDVYVIEADGTGTKNDEEFTVECGFDDDKNITMRVTLGEEEELYAISTDTTGYGVELESLNGGEDKWFLPANLEFLELDDERAAGVVGEWADASDNRYIFYENNELLIKGSKEDSEGTFSLVQNEEGTLLVNLVINGSALEFEYTLNEDNSEMELCSPGTDTIHKWTKQ